jgi:hypothetical protein
MSSAGVNPMIIASDETLLRSRRFDVIAIEVERVDADGATNSRPPTVRLRLLEVLRGRKRGAVFEAIWQAAPEPVATAENGVGLADADAYGTWLAAPFRGPATGERYVALVDRSAPGAPTILYRCRAADSPAERARIKALLGR